MGKPTQMSPIRAADPDIPSHAELVGRARELRPLVRRHASEGEINRRLSDEVIDALTKAGLFRLFISRSKTRGTP